MGISTPEQKQRLLTLKNLKQIPLTLKIAGSVTWHCLFLGFSISKLKRHFDQFYTSFCKSTLSPTSMTLEELHQLYSTLCIQLKKGWGITLLNDGYAFIFSSLSRFLLKKLKIDRGAELFNDLLAAESKIESVKPLHSIMAMVDYLKNHPDLLGSLRQPQALENLKQFPNEFLVLFQHHLDQFGDRGVAELKLETQTFRVRPLLLIHLVLSYVDNEVQFRESQIQGVKTRKSAEKEVRTQGKKHPILWCLLKASLFLAKRSIAYRESSRLDRARVFGMVRTLALAIGSHWKQDGTLLQQEDIFYLTFEDVSNHIFGISCQPDLKKTVAERKSLERRYHEITPAERIVFDDSPYRVRFPSEQNHPVTQPATSEEVQSKVLTGVGCAPGRVISQARIVKDPQNAKDVKGKILVAHMTDPGWVFLMVSASGLIVEKGSLLSHTAIIGRELGIPTIVGVKNATQLIQDGREVTMDSSDGTIYL